MKSFTFFLIGAVFGILLIFVGDYIKNLSVLKPVEKRISEVIELPLEKYSFERLRKHKFISSQIKIGKEVKRGEGFTSYMFYYTQDPLFGKNKKGEPLRISGLMNVPTPQASLDGSSDTSQYPVIVMFRGFVEREKFTSGEGTRRTAEELARNGFITLAPDFLGYGESDTPEVGSIEDRLQTYTTALSLLSSLESLPVAFKKGSSEVDPTVTGVEPLDLLSGVQPLNRSFDQIQPDLERIGVWGHSNGGHIALASLAISRLAYPTVLWNPVSKPFPYSILYFTDEYDDQGKALRRVVSNFEADYDVFLYSPERYYSWLQASIQLHQAVDDEAVPVRWSDQLEASLTELEKDVKYYKYPGENHNFNLGSWNTAVSRSIEFYNEWFRD